MMDQSRRKVIIITVAVLVVAGIALGAYLFGRSTTASPDPSPTPPTTASQTRARPSVSYEPTDENGSPEPGLPRGQAIAGAGGTTTGPAGLPLGYSHDQTGAVNAATNYLIWMNSLKITDKKNAEQMADATAADGVTRQELIDTFDTMRAGTGSMTANEPEPARGAYAIAIHSPDRALIYVWYPEVTETAGQTEHWWAIDAVSLVWASGDWKLDDNLITEIGLAAVEPAEPAGNPTTEEKHSILSRTPADPGEITDSADQSWFEYANAPR